MKRAGSLSLPILFLLACESGVAPDPEPELAAEPIEVRVFNNSELTFDEVTVEGVDFGAVAGGSFSEYHTIREAFGPSVIVVRVDSTELFHVLVEPDGSDAPLEPGRHTFLLSVYLETKTLFLHMFRGDEMPTGEQVPGRDSVVMSDHSFPASSPLGSSPIGSSPTTDGGIVIAGVERTNETINPTISSVPGSNVIFLPDALVRVKRTQFALVKIDAAGNRLWVATYGDRTDPEKESPVVVGAPGGGFVLAGTWRRLTTFSDGTSGFGDSDVWLVGVTPQGAKQWSRFVGDGSHERVSAIRATVDGGFVIAGGKDGQPWLTKLEPDGSESWSVTLDKPFGKFSEGVESIEQTSDRGYVIVGDRRSFLERPGWITRLDVAGQPKWTTPIEWSATSVAIANDGGFVVAGTTDGSGKYDALVVKLDSLGSIQWEQTVGGQGIDNACCVLEATDGGFVTAGKFGGDFVASDFMLAKLSTAGEVEWIQTFDRGGNEAVHSLQATVDGGFIMVGTSGSGAWIVKTDAGGVMTWDRLVTAPLDGALSRR